MQTNKNASISRFFGSRKGCCQAGGVHTERIAMPTKLVLLLALTLVMLLFGSLSAEAQTVYYVNTAATGADDGSDWNNAYSSLPKTLVRGAIYYIADGSYDSYTCDDPTSGSSYITIKKATPSDHGTDTGWDNSYGDATAIFTKLTITTSYWIIDGSKRGSDWKTGYGIEIDTTSHHGKGLNIPSGSTNSYITLRYIYFHGAGPDDAAYGNDLVYALSSGSNLTVQYCYFHDAGRCHFLIRSMSSGLVEYCYFYLNESTDSQHSESFSVLGGDNWIIRYNIFDTIQGTGVIMVGNAGGWKVYGNVFYNYVDAGNGIFAGWTAEYMRGGEFYNNTLLDCNVARIGMTNDINIIAKNNVFINNTYVGFAGQNTHDYNGFSGTSAYGEAHAQTGLTSTIFVNYAVKNFRLSTATLAGTNIGSEYNKDMDGNTRGAVGVWDRGAFEYTGAQAPSAPSAPSGLRIISP